MTDWGTERPARDQRHDGGEWWAAFFFFLLLVLVFRYMGIMLLRRRRELEFAGERMMRGCCNGASTQTCIFSASGLSIQAEHLFDECFIRDGAVR